METRARSAKRRRLSALGLDSLFSSPPSSPERLTPTPESTVGLLTPPPSGPSGLRDGCTFSSKGWAKSAAPTALDGPKFPLFPKLPAELRIEIWRLWAEASRPPIHPLRVRLYRGYERTKTGERKPKRTYITKSVLRLTAMPDLARATQMRRIMLSVCREARYEFLREWPETLDLDRGGLLRFDPFNDIVYLDIVNRSLMDDMVSLRRTNELPDFARTIGHLGFDMVPHLPQWSLTNREHMDPQLDFLLCFANLHSLSLINFDTLKKEVDWSDDEDVGWLMARSTNHRIQLRSFPVLPGIDYRLQCAKGRRTVGGHERHECAICMIHKCVYVREFLKNTAPPFFSRQKLTDEEDAWLANLEFHTLVASTPKMAAHMATYDGTPDVFEEVELSEEAHHDSEDDESGDNFDDEYDEEDL